MRRPVEPLTPPPEAAPAPSQGRHLHLRAPQSKSERRLAAKLMRELKGRNRALKELIRCNRAIEQLEADLRKAGMVQEAPNGAGEVHTRRPAPVPGGPA